MELFISKPCHQNWDAMAGSGSQRFCECCQLKVHDFTNNSGRDIEEKFIENKGSLCGKVTGKYLSQQYQSHQLKRRGFNQMKIFFFAVLLGFGANLFTLEGVRASSILGELKEELLRKDSLRMATIKGELKDKESEEPLLFANVKFLFNDSIEIARVMTDIDGHYEIKLDPLKYPKVSLEVSYIGYETIVIRNIILTDNNVVNISIKGTAVILGTLEYHEPLIDQFRSGKTIDRDDIRRMPK